MASPVRTVALLAAALLCLGAGSPQAASVSYARASADIPIRTGPGMAYETIGMLREGARVRLHQCTASSGWCLFLSRDGEPVGWVRGSYLVGSGAKLNVTPNEFLTFDPLDPLNLCDDDDHDDWDASYDEFCW